MSGIHGQGAANMVSMHIGCPQRGCCQQGAPRRGAVNMVTRSLDWVLSILGVPRWDAVNRVFIEGMVSKSVH